MRKITLGVNFTMFLLFFGIATIEAFQSRNWSASAFWLAIGIAFLAADNLRNRGDGRAKSHEKDFLSRPN